MPQAIVKNIGGTVETYILDRQPASCTFALYNADGGSVASGSATVDSVSTTISVEADVGDITLTVASASGIAAGRRYLLDGTTPEVVTVKDIESTVVTLTGKLMFRHDSGDTFKGTRLTAAISSSEAGALFFDGYCRFTPITGEPVEEVVDCVLRKIPNPLIDETDIYKVIPKTADVLDEELDMIGAIADARNGFLEDLGGKFRAHTMIGTEHMRRPCALRFWLDRRHSVGDQWEKVMQGIADEYDLRLDKLRSQIPVDTDQDGTTNGPDDFAFTTIRLQRA